MKRFNKKSKGKIFYVHKAGANLNGGRSLEDAFLTFGFAIAEASEMKWNRVQTIWCKDAGVYEESLVISHGLGINILASNATILAPLVCRSGGRLHLCLGGLDGSAWNDPDAKS